MYSIATHYSSSILNKQKDMVVKNPLHTNIYLLPVISIFNHIFIHRSLFCHNLQEFYMTQLKNEKPQRQLVYLVTDCVTM